MSEKTTKLPELKDDIIALAEKIEAGISLDANTGLGTETSDLYKDNLPDDLNMEVVAKVTDYNTNFIAAGAYAFGKMSVDAMANNKELKETSAELSMGVRDSISYNVNREKEFVNHLAGGEKTTKFGNLTAAYDVRSGKSGGQLKAARTLIANMALEKLKD